jgi:hypothetical protein
MSIDRTKWLKQRTKWRATRKDREARWRGTPDGRVVTVFKCNGGGGRGHAPSEDCPSPDLKAGSQRCGRAWQHHCPGT